MRIAIATAAAALCASAMVLPADASAQTSPSWKWEAVIYGYLPAIGGKTAFPPTGAGSDVSVDVDQILDNLKFTFMGALDVNNGRWGAFTDLIYLDLGNSKSDTRDLTLGGVQLPAGASANAHFDMKSWVWTLGGTYRVVSNPGSTMDVFGGARMVDITQRVEFELTGNIGSIPLPGRSGNQEVGVTYWDGVVGVKGRAALGEDRKWFATYYADIGAGDSDLTWQVLGGVGYAFGWGEVIAVWRYIDYRFKSGLPIRELNFSGPAIGAVFHW